MTETGRSQSQEGYPVGAVRRVQNPSQTVIDAKVKSKAAIDVHRARLCDDASSVIDDKIDAWHNGAGEGQELHEYLGWTWEQFKAYVERNVTPDDGRSQS